MKGLVLSLFPGIGLLDMAFEEAGFCVVRGPDLLWGGDVRNFHAPAGRFDGVIGGPPCQSHSVAIAARGGAQAATHPDQIPEFERILAEARPSWFLMENVPGAPPCQGSIWSEVLDAWAFGAAQHRRRRFSSNIFLSPIPIPESARNPDPWPCITATEYKCSPGSNERTMRQRAGRKVGRRLTIAEINEGMGLPREFATPGLTMACSYQVRGNGVPLPMGRAVAAAVVRALETNAREAA